MRVLDKTVCVLLTCTLWTGRRRLHPDDLGALAEELPPEELASMGSLKLCDPVELNELARIKRRAERALERLAVKFLGGFATDEANVDRIVDTLTELKTQFDAAASRVVSGLQGMIDKWVDEHPQWEEAIRRNPPNVNRIAAQLGFDFQVIRIVPPSNDGAPENDGLERAVGGLSQQLYREISAQARTIVKRSFEGKDIVGQRAVKSIGPIAEKLDALSYLDGGIRPVLAKVESVRDALPKTGAIGGNDLVDVMGLLNLLSNQDQLAKFGGLKAAANGAGATQSAAVVNGSGAAAQPQKEAGNAPLHF